jgi:hypothetical protein
VLACLVFLVMGTPLAHADAKGIESAYAVFELYVGTTSVGDTPAYVKALTATLDNQSNVAILTRAKAETLLAKKSLRAARISSTELAAQENLLKHAVKTLLKHGGKAIPILEKNIHGHEKLLANMMYNAKLHALYFRTNMLLARAYFDAGNATKMNDTLERVIRQVGTAKVTEENYHPTIVAAWAAISTKLNQLRTARLTVTSTPPGCQVVIRGSVRPGVTPITMDKLLPGSVQVQVIKDGASSVGHTVQLIANETATVDIDLAFENSIQLTGNAFGMKFKDQDAFEKNGPAFGARLGKLLDVDKVLLAGLQRTNEGTRFVAYVVDVATGVISFKDRVVAKANVVMKSQVDVMALAVAKTSATAVTGPWHTNTLGWVTATAAVGSIIVGAILFGNYRYKVDQAYCQITPDCTPELTQTQEEYDNARTTQGFGGGALLAVGSVLAITSALVFVYLKPKLKAADQSADAGFELKTIGPTTFTHGAAGVSAQFSF